VKAKYILGILFLLLIFYAISNAIWIHCGASLYGRDVVGHLQLVVKFYYVIGDILHSAVSPLAKIGKIFSLLHEDSLPFHGTYMWPKLVHVVATIPCLLFGLRHIVIIQCNILFLGILVASVYFIGKKCYSSPAGLFAAVLVSLYPAVYGQSRKFGLDFPVTAMTSLAIAVLIFTDHFRNRKYSLLLGLAFGLGILTKGQIILYLGGPLLIDLLIGLGERRERRLACLVNFAAAILIALLVSSPWWWGIALDLWRAYFATVTDYPFSWAYAYQRQVPLTVRWLLFHLIHGSISISLLYAFVFALSLPGYVRSRFNHKIIISSWLLVPYAIWTVSNIKRDTDFYPCLPAIALISAIGIISWQKLRIKKIMITAAVLLGLVQYFSVSFSRGGYLLWTSNNPYGKPCEPDGYNPPFQPPYPNNYREVMREISQRIRRNDPDAKYGRIGIIETAGPERWLEYSTIILEYYFRLDHPGYFIYLSRHTPQAFLEHCLSFEYLIVIDKRNGDTPDWTELKKFFEDERWKQYILDNYADMQKFYSVIDSFKNYQLLIKQTLLPEKYGILLFEKRPAAISNTSTEIPASCYTRSNLLTSPGLIGAKGVHRHDFWEPDYDLFFPYWLRFPLTDSELRYPGDPYFCEYMLIFQEEGEYKIFGKYAAREEAGVQLYWDGILLSENALEESRGDRAHEWKYMATVTVSSGLHTLRFKGEYNFPFLMALRFQREDETGQRTGR